MEAKIYIRKEIITAVPVKLVNGNVWPEGLPLPEVPDVEELAKEICHGVNVCAPQIQDGFTWSDGSIWPIAVPKKHFEEMGFRVADNMSFGDALEAVKQGKRIARKGWNGKNMSVAYQKGYPEGIPCNENTARAWGMEVGELFKCRPYLQLRCADGSFQMWLASQSDILADDWYIVE